MTIHLRTWGDLACFTRPEIKVERPEMKVERVSWRIRRIFGSTMVARSGTVRLN